jgi:hypothetical protein
VRNSIRHIVDVLASPLCRSRSPFLPNNLFLQRLLIDSGAAPPTPEQIVEGGENSCRSACIRGASLLCLLDLYIMLLSYCGDQSTGLPSLVHEDLVLSATRIARAWGLVEPYSDYEAYMAGSDAEISIGI